jgi:hypothetical protein
MSYLVRKITRAKWSLDNGIVDNPFDIPADAIVLDLKTTSNTLSVWEVQDEQSLDNAVLAIVSGGNQLDTIDVVWIEKNEIERKGVEYQSSKGITPIEHLVDTHIDLMKLNYFKMGLVAETITNTIADSKIKRYTKGEIKKLLNSAIESGSVKIEQLLEGIVKGL